MTNPIDNTNEYLEYLAGRRATPPPIDDEQKDILEAAHLLRTMRQSKLRPEFQQTLRQSLMQPNVPASKKQTNPKLNFDLAWWKKFALPTLGAVAVVVAVIIINPWNNDPTNSPFKKYVGQEAQAADVSLVPTKGTDLGVEANTSFRLSAKTGTLSQKDVQENLKFSPDVDFSIKPVGNNTYEITPNKALANNVVYAATFLGEAASTDNQTKPYTYSWAYQVRRDFQILGTLPRDKTAYVAPATGIEFTFSMPGVDANTFKQHLEIKPSTAGRVEAHGRTMVFVPKDKLKEQALYTVTLKKGLSSGDNQQKLEEDFVFQFETTSDRPNTSYGLSTPRPFEGVRPGDPIVFDVINGSEDAKRTFEFTVYQYKDINAFRRAMETRQEALVPWATFANQSYIVPTDGLQKVGTYKTKIQNEVVTLENTFEPGFYLAVSTSNNVRSQIPFQVGDLGVYAVTSQTDTFIWANNVKTGKPLSGAKITGKDINVTTNDQGTATVATPNALKTDAADPIIAELRAEGQATLVVLYGKSTSNQYMFGRGGDTSQEYWSMVTTDRRIYQPNDTVQFWGMVRPRDSGQTVKQVRADLVMQTYVEASREAVVSSTTLSLSSAGTFIGQMKLRDVPSEASKVIKFYVGDTLVMTKYLEVRTFRKPPYQLTLQADKAAIIAGEEVTFTVATNFFDGTPVPGAKVKLNVVGEHALTTGADGRAEKKIKLFGDGNSGFATGSSAYATSDDLGGDLSAYAYVSVYPSSIQIEATGRLDNGRATITGLVRDVHPDRADPTAEDPLAKVAGQVKSNQLVHGEVIAHRYDKIEEGAYYDFLAKQTKKRYRYQAREEKVTEFDVTTNTQGEFSATVPLSGDGYFEVRLTSLDAQKRTARQTVYLYDGGFTELYNDYNLVDTKTRPNQPSPEYSVGDQVSMAIEDASGKPVNDPSFHYVFMVDHRGIRQTKVQSSSQFTFTYDNDYVPYAHVRAAIFNGKGYQELYAGDIRFKTKDRQLSISITPDKTSYHVQDKVKLNVKVTDQHGQGQAAQVNLKAIDEAIVALQGPEYQTALGDVYEYVGDGVFGSFISHQAFARDMFAEGGGGGDDRTEFKDTVLFTEITTNSAGVGTAEFSLPDNLTSWRVTATAVTDDLKVGQQDRLLPVTQPLFAVTTWQDEMLDRDQQTLLVSAFGTGLSNNDQVQFTLTIDDQKNAIVTKQGKAFEPVGFPLPSLSLGQHNVRVTAAAKGQTDAITQPLTVLSSRLQQRTTKIAYLDRNQKPELSSNGRTEVLIGDADRTMAYQMLWGLLGNPYSRLDDTVAASIAARILNDEFKETAVAEYDPQQFVTGKGLALYAIGDEDLQYGSLAVADPRLESVRPQVLGWFRTTLDNPKSNSEQVAYALYGLAQLHEPVLPEIHVLLANPDLVDHDRLTLALALEAIGAKEEAQPIVQGLLKKYAEQADQYLRINLGEDQDEQIVNTARLAIVATSLNLPEQYGLLQYVAAHPPQDTTTHLETALALDRLLDHASTGKVSVTYTLDGQSVTKELSKTESLKLTLDANQAKSFSITGHTGNVAVVTGFQVPFDASKITTDANLSIDRTYSVNGKRTTTFKRGDIVKIDLSWSKKSGALGTHYGIIDHLPTGLRVLSNPWLYNRSSTDLGYPYATDGQRIKFYAGLKTFHYYAVATVDGTYVAEPPMIQAFDAPSSIRYGTASGQIVIKP